MDNKITAFVNEQLKTEIPQFEIGDTVEVQNRIKEGSRERIQVFEGTIISKKHGGITETFTVRRISYGVGVERTFPVNSPKLAKIEVVRKGKGVLCSAAAASSAVDVAGEYLPSEIAKPRNLGNCHNTPFCFIKSGSTRYRCVSLTASYICGGIRLSQNNRIHKIIP